MLGIRLILCVVMTTHMGYLTFADNLCLDGQEYVFAVPQVTKYTVDPQPDIMIATSSENAINVSLSVPGQDFEFNGVIRLNNEAVIKLPYEAKPWLPGYNRQTVIVRSTGEISVYCLDNQSLDIDGFLALPNVFMGTEYYIVTYYAFSYSFFVVSALQYQTSVQFKNINDFQENVILKPYESYKYDVSEGDASGIRVISDWPVSVVSGAFVNFPWNQTIDPDSTTTDTILTNIPPIEKWGKSFILAPFLTLTCGYICRLFNSVHQDATINISDIGSVLLPAGEFYEFDVTEEKMVAITSSSSVLVAQYMRNCNESLDGGRPSVTIVPALKDYYQNETFYVYHHQSIKNDDAVEYVNIISKCNETAGLLLDDITSLEDWNRLTTDDETMCVIRGEISGGSHKIVNVIPDSKFVVTVYMMNHRTSYIYQAAIGYKAPRQCAPPKEEFKVRVEAVMEEISNFKPSAYPSDDDLIKQLGILGTDVFNLMADNNKTYDYMKGNRQDLLTRLSAVTVAESFADVTYSLASYIPEGKELTVTIDGIDAAAKIISHEERNQRVYTTLIANMDKNAAGERSTFIKIEVLTSKIPDKEFAQGTAALTSVHVGDRTNVERVPSVVKKNESETGTEYVYPQSGVLDVRLIVNNLPYSVPIDFEIPTSANKTQISNASFYEREETFCAFWNKSEEAFSTDGLSKTKEDNTSVSCHSNHTTSFAVLLRVVPRKPDSADSKIMEVTIHDKVNRVLTRFFGSVSIISLMLLIVVLMAFESLRREQRNIIHVNLGIALLVAHLGFLVAIDKTENKTGCNVIAMLLHYSFLSVFGWMLVEGINLYYNIVLVYGAEKNRLPLFLGIGWGLPLPIVIISAAVRFNSYASQNSCWLNTYNGMIWAFAAPALLVIGVNTILLCVIGRILYKSANVFNADDNKAGIRTSVKGAVILTPLLGITWIFGILAINEVAAFFQYIFVICNSLQGFFIFMIYCLLNSEVKAVVKRALKRHEIVTSNGVMPQPGTDDTPASNMPEVQ